MKSSNIKKRVLLLALCSLLSFTAVQGYTYAESTTPSTVSMDLSNSSIKSLKFSNGTATVSLTENFIENGYLAINISKSLVDYSSNALKPVKLTYSYNGSSKTIELTKSIGVYTNKNYYKFYLGGKNTVAKGDITITDPGKSFDKDFKVYFDVSTNQFASLVPATSLNDITTNNIDAYFPFENPEVYSGFVFTNTDSGNKFFIRPDANTETITLNIGAANDYSYSYNSGIGNSFIIQYYNNKDTYNDIQQKGAYTKDKKPKYRQDQYYRVETPIISNASVNLPWLQNSGIIEISLKTPDILKINLSVRANPDRVNISNPSTPSVDNSIYNPSNAIQPGVIAPAVDVKPVGVSRLSGDNRYETSLKLSKETFTSSSVAVVASGENFADALSGGGLAAAYNAPLLLVNNSYASDVNSELNRLGVKTVYVLGGQNSISSTIENKLSKNAKNEKRTVIRLAGDNRYETSMAIYNEVTKMAGMDKNPILVNGNTFADALSAGPLAAKLKKAIVLTNGKKVSYLIDKTNKRNIIIGGYKSMDGSFLGDRIYGDNRYETAASIASRFYNPQAVMIASGVDYPDGLSAITLYSKYNSPLLLTSKYNLPKQVKSYIKDQKVGSAIIVGGQGSVSNSVENELK